MQSEGVFKGTEGKKSIEENKNDDLKDVHFTP